MSGLFAEDVDAEDVRRLALLADRKDRKERQRYHEMVMEELVPKPTGRCGWPPDSMSPVVHTAVS